MNTLVDHGADVIKIAIETAQLAEPERGRGEGDRRRRSCARADRHCARQRSGRNAHRARRRRRRACAHALRRGGPGRHARARGTGDSDRRDPRRAEELPLPCRQRARSFRQARLLYGTDFSLVPPGIDVREAKLMAQAGLAPTQFSPPRPAKREGAGREPRDTRAGSPGRRRRRPRRPAEEPVRARAHATRSRRRQARRLNARSAAHAVSDLLGRLDQGVKLCNRRFEFISQYGTSLGYPATGRYPMTKTQLKTVVAIVLGAAVGSAVTVGGATAARGYQRGGDPESLDSDCQAHLRCTSGFCARARRKRSA